MSLGDVTGRAAPGGRAATASLLLTAATVCLIGAPARAATPRIPENQPLVMLLSDHIARTAPSAQARRIETVSALRPLTGVRTILPVLGRRTSSDGTRWVHVRPNGHDGWIPDAQTTATSTEWALTLDQSARQRPLRRAAGVRLRAWPDRHSRHQQPPRSARVRGVPRLHAPRHDRDPVVAARIGSGVMLTVTR